MPSSRSRGDLAAVRPIGVFDSGLGGLSVLRCLREALPGEAFVYVADSARAPYGDRPVAEVLGYSREIVDYLVGEAGCKAVVMACNTATAAAAETLRAERPGVPIVGMEPAVKPAAAATRTGVIGVMATAGTIASDKYAALLSQHGDGARVLEDPCVGLVRLIEAGHLDDEVLRARLREIVPPMVAAGADAIVLGCTHFPLVIDEIRALAGPQVVVIDPAPAVARQVGRVLRESDPGALGSDDLRDSSPTLRLLTSGDVRAFRQNVRRVLGERVLTEGEGVVEAWAGANLRGVRDGG